jgi:mannose-6-phosphate isomerase-like protein (cupin superfamily)
MSVVDERLQLSPEYVAWIAENLLRGVRRGRLEEALVAAGLDARRAAREVDAVLASPVLAGARRAVVAGRRAELVLGLLRAVAREALPESRVPVAASIDADTLLVCHYATSTPLLLPGYARSWPATRKWTPEYFAERFGDVEVEYVEGREGDPDYDMHTPALARRGTLREYVARVRAAGETNDLYLVANNRNLDRPELSALWDDVEFPAGILDPGRRKGCAALWIGPAGTVTPFHHDTSNILFVQLYGRKRFRLASPVETSLLRGARAMYAAYDPERPERMPEVDARIATVDLGPGDVLFLPVGWWHHVRALDVSVSLAMNGFSRRNVYDWYRPGDVR